MSVVPATAAGPRRACHLTPRVPLIVCHLVSGTHKSRGLPRLALLQAVLCFQRPRLWPPPARLDRAPAGRHRAQRHPRSLGGGDSRTRPQHSGVGPRTFCQPRAGRRWRWTGPQPEEADVGVQGPIEADNYNVGPMTQQLPAPQNESWAATQKSSGRAAGVRSTISPWNSNIWRRLQQFRAGPVVEISTLPNTVQGLKKMLETCACWHQRKSTKSSKSSLHNRCHVILFRYHININV